MFLPSQQSNITLNSLTNEKSVKCVDVQLTSPAPNITAGLEINTRKVEILEKINSNLVTIIQAPTGTGKVSFVIIFFICLIN